MNRLHGLAPWRSSQQSVFTCAGQVWRPPWLAILVASPLDVIVKTAREFVLVSYFKACFSTCKLKFIEPYHKQQFDSFSLRSRLVLSFTPKFRLHNFIDAARDTTV